LGLAEVKAFWRGRLQVQGALEAGLAALAIFQSLGDRKMEAFCQLALANIYFMKEKADSVSCAAKEAMLIFEDIGDRKAMAKALHGRALSCFLRDDYADMLSFAQEACDIYRELGAKRLEVFEFSALAQFFLRAGKPAKALAAAHEGFAVSRGVASAGKALQAFLLLLIVESLSEIGRKRPALKAAKQGLARFRDLGDPRANAYALQVVLFAHCELDEYDGALGAAEEALGAARELCDQRMELDLHFLVAIVQLRRGEPDAALEAMRSAREIGSGLEDLEEEACAERMVSEIYLELLDTASALKAAARSRRLFERAGDAIGEASALILSSFAHALSGQLGRAVTAATEARDIYEEQESVAGEGIALRQLAELQVQAERYDLASQAAQRRLELWEDAGNSKEMAYALHSLASVHIAGGSLEEAEGMAQQALGLCREVGDRHLEVGLMLELTAIQVMRMDREASPDAAAPSPGFAAACSRALGAATEAFALACEHCAGGQGTGLRAQAAFWRAQMLYCSGGDSEALRMARHAERLFSCMGRSAAASEALTLQAFALLGLGDRKQAMKAAEDALVLARACCAAAAEKSASAFFDQVQRDDARREQAEQTVAIQAPGPLLPQAAPDDAGDKTAVVPAVEAPPEPKGLDPVVVRERLMQMVLDAIASEEEDLQVDTPFMDAGMDSLSSVQFVTEVSREFSMKLSPSLVFDYPNVRGFLGYLVEESKNASRAY